jgi:hypothetical protein
MPAGFSFGLPGRIWNWPVFIARLISLSESAITVERDDNDFKKASKDIEAVNACREVYGQERYLFASSTLSQQIRRLTSRS